MPAKQTGSSPGTESALLTDAEGAELADLPPQALRYIGLMREVPAVRHIAFGRDGAALRLWAVTDTYDFDANDRIFTRELVLYDEWPDAKYDFHVVPLEGRPLGWVLPDSMAVIWTRPQR